MLYTLGIYLYGLLLKIASLFHPKAQKWVKGRKGFFQNLPAFTSENVIWFHCASLGEYDQGKPIMEAWKKKYPHHFILVTFFSPSGYENCVQNSVGDYTCYLPLDTPKNAQKFIEHFQPQKAFFIKYEVWINYFKAAHQANCELYAISANYRKEQIYFRWYGGYFRKAIALFKHIFVQYENNIALLNSIGITPVSVSGDTRYDRVYQRTLAVKENEILAEWKNKEDVFVIGSSWPEDEEILLPFINDGTITEKVILAPHEIKESHVQEITQALKVKYQLYTDIQNGESLDQGTRVVILNCIGVLAEAYKYGNSAYIGGAFRTGLHNILEPAAFGLPVIFGPNHTKFPEAQAFIQEGIGKSISNRSTFQQAYTNFKKLSDSTAKVSAFVKANIGATQIVMDYFTKED